MEINVLTPSEAYYWATRCAIQARRTNSRGMGTREVQNFTAIINYPYHLPPYLPERKARHFIGAVEALQLIGQAPAPEVVTDKVAAMWSYANDGIFWGSYGARVYGQLSNVARTLAGDAGTRRAVLSIYDGTRDLERPVNDVPCTLTIQFLNEQGRLGMRVSMRSNDVWLGLPYDLFQFASLQCAMADSLGTEPGLYAHTVGSLHIYERDVEKAAELKSPIPPGNHEFKYHRHFNGTTIGDISARCRRILFGLPVQGLTDFESYLMESLS